MSVTTSRWRSNSPAIVLLVLTSLVLENVLLLVLQGIPLTLELSVGSLEPLCLHGHVLNLLVECVTHSLQLCLLAGGQLQGRAQTVLVPLRILLSSHPGAGRRNIQYRNTQSSEVMYWRSSHELPKVKVT